MVKRKFFSESKALSRDRGTTCLTVSAMVMCVVSVVRVHVTEVLALRMAQVCRVVRLRCSISLDSDAQASLAADDLTANGIRRVHMGDAALQ